MAGELVITSPANGFTVNAATLTVTVTTVFTGPTQYVQISRPNFISGRPDWKEVYPGTVSGGSFTVQVPIVQGTDDWPIKIEAFEGPSESGSLLHAAPVNGTIKGITPPNGTRLVEVPVIDNTFSATIPITQGTTDLPLTVQASFQEATASVQGTITPLGPGLKSIGIEPATIIGGNSAVCTIEISLPAPAGGEVIETWSDDPSIVQVPASVTIMQGATRVSFPVTTTKVDAEILIFIWAKLRDRTIGVELPVHTPPPIPPKPPKPPTPPPGCWPVTVYCPPLVCCPRRDYGYSTGILNIWQTSDYGVNQSIKPPEYNEAQKDVSELVLKDSADLLLLTGNHRFSTDYKVTVEPFWGNMVRRHVALATPGPNDWSYSGLDPYRLYFPYPPIQPDYAYANGVLSPRTYGSARFGDLEIFMLDAGLDNSGTQQNSDVMPDSTGDLVGTLWRKEGCGKDKRIWEPQGGSAEWNWFVKAAHASTARWKIVMLHHPPLSSGAIHGSWPEFDWNFDDLGIDLVLSGHETSYERLQRDNVMYIVNGLGGASLGQFSPIINPYSLVRFNSKHGAVNFEIMDHRLVGEFIDVDQKTQDHFEILKS